MQTFQIKVDDGVADKLLWFLENLKDSVQVSKVISFKDNQTPQEYDFWNEEELEYISKVDLSTPIEDSEDYSKW
ncbi:MAG: hypothetical protein KU38_05305 [Sulfurovum sp. FS08-3]|nr:MAG: hypothetical protein KU38_05305 [Sulfurovum sp. FS08-3]